MPWSWASLRWVTLLSAGLAHGCFFFGGQTGSDRASSNCDWESIPYQRVSATGESAASLVARVGAERSASVAAAPPEFWAALGVAPPALPVPLVLRVDYAGGEVRHDTCEGSLEVDVGVLLDLGGGLVVRAGQGTLTSDGATSDTVLTASLEGAGASALSLSAFLSTTSTTGALSLVGSPATASFTTP